MNTLPNFPMTIIAGAVAKNERQLNFNCTLQDRWHAEKIASRACEEAKARLNVTLDWYLVNMDVLCVHCNGTPLKLLQLLMASASDFEHDISGIGCNLDRKTGQLLNGFVPTFAVKQ